MGWFEFLEDVALADCAIARRGRDRDDLFRGMDGLRATRRASLARRLIAVVGVAMTARVPRRAAD